MLQSGQLLARFEIELATRMVDDADSFRWVSRENSAGDGQCGLRERAGE